MKISFLHTSKSHIERFDKIVKGISSLAIVEHFVNEELLEVAQKTGKVDHESFNKEVSQIQKTGSKLIICTCSTYGELCDEKNNTYRIDEPIGAFLISHFSNIGIAFTLDSTKEISRNLMYKLAKENNKSIELFEIDCSNCWTWFEKGEIEKYERGIAFEIMKKPNHVEVVFLAQASMEGAKKYLKNEEIQVFSSPEFGVEKYLRMKAISKK